MGWKQAINRSARAVTGYELRRVAPPGTGASEPAATPPPGPLPADRATHPGPATNRSRAHQTSVTLNEPAKLENQRTYVIFGTRRGGTSMVAGMARALGLDLGNVGARTNNEDLDFQHQHVEHMRATAKRRNSDADVWGWKYPGAGEYLPDLLPFLRNPYFVVVYRDPVAAAFSQQRLDRPRSKRSLRTALHESASNATMNTGLVLSLDRPTLLVSMERARQDPEALIRELATFLQAPTPDQALSRTILEYTAPGQYKSFEDFFPPGTTPRL